MAWGGALERIFISHSALKGSRAEAVRDAVTHELRARGYEVFVDADIPIGERWRARLLDELGRCDAAVVVLDPQALKAESWWVRREVYCLLWRHYLGSVQIRGVLVDGVKPGMVKSGGYGELVELQLVTERGELCTAEQLALAVVEDLGPVRRVTGDAMRQWINRVFNVLRKVEPGETLDDFAEALGVSADDMATVFERELHRFLARQLLGRHEPVQTLHAIRMLEGALNQAELDTLAEQALPALIDSEAAWPLVVRDLQNDAVARPVFVLNAELTTTSELYVRRAACAARSYRHQFVSAVELGAGGLEGELELQCLIALARLMCMRKPAEDPEWRREMLLERLGTYQPGKTEVVTAAFLAIKAQPQQMEPVLKVVTGLRRRFPWLAIIIVTGTVLPDDTDAWGLDRVIPLRPPLRAGEEHRVDEVVVALGDMVGRELLPYG